MRNRKLKVKANTTTDQVTVNSELKRYIDLPQLVAETKAVPLLWGEGWTLHGDEGYAKDRLKEILDYNGVDGLFKSSEVELSTRVDGNQLFTIQPDTEGRIHINTAEMDTAMITGDQNGNINFAQVYIMLTVGTFKYRILQKFANGKMTTIIKQFDPKKSTYDIDLSVEDFNEATGYKLLETWIYGNKIPLVMFTNKSSSGISDAGDAIAVRELQSLLDTAMTVNNNELLLNTTKVLVKQLPSSIKTGTKLESEIQRQMFIEVDGKTDGVTVLQAEPKLKEYVDQIQYIIDKYIQAAPYSIESDFNGTQTQVGVMFKGKSDIETTRIKNTARTSQVNELLQKVIYFDSLTNVDVYFDDVYTISIDSFNVLEVADKDVKMDRMIELGIVSKRDIIAHYYDTDNDDEINRIIEGLDAEKAEQPQEMVLEDSEDKKEE